MQMQAAFEIKMLPQVEREVRKWYAEQGCDVTCVRATGPIVPFTTRGPCVPFEIEFFAPVGVLGRLRTLEVCNAIPIRFSALQFSDNHGNPVPVRLHFDAIVKYSDVCSHDGRLTSDHFPACPHIPPMSPMLDDTHDAHVGDIADGFRMDHTRLQTEASKLLITAPNVAYLFAGHNLLSLKYNPWNEV